jgi:signal transduction histidine kinase
MSNATWGESEMRASGALPSFLLKHLLGEMMVKFSAQGGCIALFDEQIQQMRIHLHLRTRGNTGLKMQRQRLTTPLQNNGPTITSGHTTMGRIHPPPPSPVAIEEEVEEVTPQTSPLFPRDSTYPPGDDLIGHAWYHNKAYIMTYSEYNAAFHKHFPLPTYPNVVPTSLLVVPVCESLLTEKAYAQPTHKPSILGVIVLYQTISGIGSGFLPRQRGEAVAYVERIALYLQNERLQRRVERSSIYLRILQRISSAFPTSVQLSDVVQQVYECTQSIVDTSSMLLTFYDRDTERIYDVFAMNNGQPVRDLMEHPRTQRKDERGTWWRVAEQMAKKELKRLKFSPAQDVRECNEFCELLTGSWGDQRQAESFLFLPMRMFTRVTGSLSLASMQHDAYQHEEIEVLETMLQIVSISLENANLYARDHQLLDQARYREEQLAAMNSSLQAISSTLNVKEQLVHLVKGVAMLVKAKICVFLQLTADGSELQAKAIYGEPGQNIELNDGSDAPATADSDEAHEYLIESIRLPFKGTFLTSMSLEGFFYLTPSQAEELAQQSGENGAIFLREAELQQTLLIPVAYKNTLMGILIVHIPRDTRILRPRAVGTLLAICSQAANAIHTAQLFEQREEAYAELERVNKLRDEFLITASHELRTPLTAISGYASHLRRLGSRVTPQQVERSASKIASAAQQLTDMISNMMDAAKMGVVDNKMDLQMGPVHMFTVAEMAVNLLNVNVEQQVTYSVPPDIWVYGDALRLRQVTSNLLDNAAKYSPPQSTIRLEATVLPLAEVANLLPEGRFDSIELAAKGHTLVVLVRVHDQGEGILPEDQQRIFEKFVRAPRSLTTPVRGSGLGLFISRRYIEAMGGWLWLERSTPQFGSTFSFYLPTIKAPVNSDGSEKTR